MNHQPAFFGAMRPLRSDNRPTASLVALFLLAAAALAAAAEGADARRESLLTDALARKSRGNMSMLEAAPFALARYWRNEDVAAADQAVIRAASPELPGVGSYKDAAGKDHYHRPCYLLQRVYFLFNSRREYFPGRMSKAAENAVAASMWKWASAACAFRHGHDDLHDQEQREGKLGDQHRADNNTAACRNGEIGTMHRCNYLKGKR